MLTKADFQRAIRDSISAYPSVAPLYQAGDPRVMQHLDAMATMLSMLSAQVDAAQAEPFEKVRDSTVLADAAMRGIVRKGKPARVRVRAANKGSASFTVETGRALLDSSGLPYRVETPAVVPPGGEATFEAAQVYTRAIPHTVRRAEPFYAIPVPQADDGSFLCGIGVSDAAGEYEYRDRYVNIGVGERVFHVEADDRQQVYVRLGFEGVVGVQPIDGDELMLSVAYTSGNISPEFGSPFSFEYLGSPNESLIELTMDAMLMAGQDPVAMSVLRDLARYPSTYDNNAVFLGEFDYLVRRNFPSLRFLSVWNEAAEEIVRGPSLDNINTLFVACLSQDGGEAVLPEPAIGQPDPQPETVPESELTETQKRIRAAILSADDSYKVRFVTPVRSKIAMSISAVVSTSYVATDVQGVMREVLLQEFGEESAASRRGSNKPLYQRVYALLKARIPALSDGDADLKVSIAEQELPRPEVWRFVSQDSLTISVVTANITTPSWG